MGESYIEDCYVCCRPIEIYIASMSEDSVEIRINRIEGNEFWVKSLFQSKYST